MNDAKALKILLRTYWSASGWKESPEVSDADFEYAKAAGHMFDPIERDHDQCVKWVVAGRSMVSREAIANAFIASLSSRRLELRSAMGSYAVAKHLPEHKFKQSKIFTHDDCAVCMSGQGAGGQGAIDLNVLNFERFKWGGVRHEHLSYIGFDLEQFRLCDFSAPSKDDYEILRQVFHAASSAPVGTSLTKLEKSLAGLFPANASERKTLITILGYCGILVPEGEPGYFHSYPRDSERGDKLHPDSDWQFPVSRWKGSGIRGEAVSYWFPEL